MGLTMAPATESIMGSVPRAKAGVGSAVNDTTRQVGGALGVAIIGSVMASTFTPRIAEVLSSVGLPVETRRQVEGQPRRGRSGSRPIPSRRSSPATRESIFTGAKDAFVAGMHRGVLVGAAAAFLGAIIAFDLAPGTRAVRGLRGAGRATGAKLEDVVAAFEPESV